MYNPINNGLDYLIDTYGIDSFTLRFAICLLGSFPLNAILKRLPDERTNLKCLYIISMSVVFLFGVMNLASGIRTLLISSMFTFLITRFYHSAFMPHLNFIFVMGHLSLNHIYAQFFVDLPAIEAAKAVDITSAQMVLAMKLTSFAWSYHDGTYLKKDEFNELTEYQKCRAVKKHPSILRFLAYVFFYPTILTGPSFDYSDFDSWLDCDFFSDLPDSEKPRSRTDKTKRRQIPKNGRLALWKVMQGIMWIGLRAYLSKFCNIEFMLNRKKFMAKSFFYRIHYMFFLGLIARFKYYAAWTISEASCIVCGLGYNGYDPKTKKIKWDRVRNIDIYNVEMAQSTRDCLEAWNMNTNKWLKNYVYLRVSKKGKKPGFRSTLFTFITSAFWHGVNPGYYLTFATGALYQTCGKFYRRNFRPIFLAEDGKTPLKYKWIYDLICMYVIKIAFGYLVQPFLVLNLKDSIQAWRSVYFYGHIIIAVSFFLFTGPFSKQVVKFCKSRQPMEIAIMKQKEMEKHISKSAYSLGDILKDKIEFEETRPIEHADMNLGIPTIYPNDWEDAKEDFAIFRDEYMEWRDKNGFEVEEANLSKAFQKFKAEVSEAANNSTERVRKMSFSAYSPRPISKDSKRKE